MTTAATPFNRYNIRAGVAHMKLLAACATMLVTFPTLHCVLLVSCHFACSIALARDIIGCYTAHLQRDTSSMHRETSWSASNSSREWTRLQDLRTICRWH